MIEVEGLRKSFRAVHAVEDVSFVARDGEITGLIGPNGAGKTTTLRILYTILRPDAGAARVDGLDTVRERRHVQRRIGVLPDNRGLYTRLTAREHVRYFGRLHGLRGPELDRRIDALIAELDMEEFADRRTKGFSRGQTLKVALARCLVHEPPNVMFDEPTNGLDVSSSRAMRALIRRIRDEGRCVLLSSHYMTEVHALCDRIVVMGKGRVVAEGSPEELMRATGKTDLEDVFVSLHGGPRAAAVEEAEALRA
ncbi:MAG: ATP-binding cassette domain-containing protein [Alphaproteobacteria bacterium]